MNVTRVFETAKIAIHWDHIISPTDPNSGKDREISWKGTAQKIAGLVILALSTALVGAVPTMILFSIAIPYYTYTAYEKTHAVSEDEGSSPVKQQLSEEEIEKLNQLGVGAILKASTEGKKVGLIIGRCKDQPVPVEDGWLWVAGNIEGDPAVLKNRVDLQMDFNDSETIERLEGVFDRVVVDFSTLKFIHGPWRFLRPLLKPSPESQLITEKLKGTLGIRFDLDEPYIDCAEGSICYSPKKERAENGRLFQEWKDQVGETEFKRKKSNFLSKMDVSRKEELIRFGGEHALDREFFNHILNEHYPNRFNAQREAVKMGVEKIRHYLKSLFNRVEIYDNSAPFPTRQGCHAEKAEHFVLTGPAQRSKERRKVFEVV